MYEYLKAKSFSPVIFSFGPRFICIAALESEKALAWRSGTQQKEPIVFHHSNCSRSAFSGSEARGNTIKSEMDDFTLQLSARNVFPHIGSLLPRQAGLASGIWTALDGTGRHWAREVDGGEGKTRKGPTRQGTTK